LSIRKHGYEAKRELIIKRRIPGMGMTLYEVVLPEDSGAGEMKKQNR